MDQGGNFTIIPYVIRDYAASTAISVPTRFWGLFARVKSPKRSSSRSQFFSQVAKERYGDYDKERRSNLKSMRKFQESFNPKLCGSLGHRIPKKVFGASCPGKIPKSFCS
jgi:hypothetical protein